MYASPNTYNVCIDVYAELIAYGLNHSDGCTFAFPQSNSFTTVSTFINADDKMSTSGISQSHQHLRQHILIRKPSFQFNVCILTKSPVFDLLNNIDSRFHKCMNILILYIMRNVTTANGMFAFMR